MSRMITPCPHDQINVRYYLSLTNVRDDLTNVRDNLTNVQDDLANVRMIAPYPDDLPNSLIVLFDTQMAG